MAKIAFLVFENTAKPSRRKNKSFDWSGNVGAYMVIDALRRDGITVGFCSTATAKNYDLVLVSMTSVHDTFNFLHAVGRSREWKNRTFKVLAGGFGCQNVFPLQGYVDYAFFGRAENVIAEIIALVLDGDDSHESLMDLTRIKQVKMCQTDKLYPYVLQTQPHTFQEKSLGCKNKCSYCHYSFSRKWIPRKGEYEGALLWGGYQQETFHDVIGQADTHLGQLSTAIDGFSERLRVAFNKPILNAEIRETIEWISHNWEHSAMGLNLYCIGNYPTETDGDRDELKGVFAQCRLGKTRIAAIMKVFPLIPAALTPSAYLPVNLGVSWNKRKGDIYYEKPGLRVKLSPFLKTRYGHLVEVIAERATEKSQRLIETICWSKQLRKLNAPQKLIALKRAFDLTPYTREYSVDEPLPEWYLESYIPRSVIKKMATKLKRDLGLKPMSYPP